MINIAGIPYINFLCFVLCLNMCIPIKEPGDPPIIAIKNSEDSLILYLPFFALLLSIHIDIKPIRLIIAIYIIKYLNIPHPILKATSAIFKRLDTEESINIGSSLKLEKLSAIVLDNASISPLNLFSAIFINSTS